MKQINFQSVFDTPTVKMGSMNEQVQTPDGRIWEYLYATEAISAYMIATRPANTTVTTVSSSSNGRSQKVYVTEASAGWTVNAYCDHWIDINTGTGVGQIAKVKGNTADTLELYEQYALTTGLAVADSGFAIVHQPDAEKAPVTTEITPVQGVAQVAFASGDYGYFLKRGIGGVMCGGSAITINYSITTGDDTEGYGITGTTAKGPMDENYVGRVLVAASTGDEACLADINIL